MRQIHRTIIDVGNGIFMKRRRCPSPLQNRRLATSKRIAMNGKVRRVVIVAFVNGLAVNGQLGGVPTQMVSFSLVCGVQPPPWLIATVRCSNAGCVKAWVIDGPV